MKKMRYLSVILVTAVACNVSVAGAAEPSASLKQVQGRVLVRHSQTGVLAQDGTSVYAGDQVFAVAGASAQLVYSDGCSVALPEYSLLAVEGPNQCSAGLAQVQSTKAFKKAVGQTSSDVSRALAEIKSAKGSYDLATAYSSLDASQRSDLINSLTDSQLAQMYVAIYKVEGQVAADQYWTTVTSTVSQSRASDVSVEIDRAIAKQRTFAKGEIIQAPAVPVVSQVVDPVVSSWCFGVSNMWCLGAAAAAVLGATAWAASGNGGKNSQAVIPVTETPTTITPTEILPTTTTLRTTSIIVPTSQ
jgi:hypothetical protein